MSRSPLAHPTTKARCEMEIEADRLFLMGILRRGGYDLSVAKAAKILNDRRAEAARQTMLEIGASEEEADAHAEAARLSPKTIQRDHRVVLSRLREGVSAVSASLLDDQIAEVRADIESSYRVEDEAWQDIERSRTKEWKRVQAAAGEMTTTTHVETVPAAAALYAVILKSIQTRESLRQELRSLKWGRQNLVETEEDKTFAQLITDLEDPEKAHDAVVSLYTRELETLYRSDGSEAGIATPHLIQMHRARSQRLASRARLLREYLPLIGANGKTQPFELVVKRISSGAGGDEP